MKTNKTDKHTPGPWQYDSDGHFVCVDMDASKMICDIRGWGWLQKMGHQKAVETQIANAKLIASAPDLLEACQWALKQFEKLSDDGRYPEHLLSENGGNGFTPLVNAIKKATL